MDKSEEDVTGQRRSSISRSSMYGEAGAHDKPGEMLVTEMAVNDIPAFLASSSSGSYCIKEGEEDDDGEVVEIIPPTTRRPLPSPATSRGRLLKESSTRIIKLLALLAIESHGPFPAQRRISKDEARILAGEYTR